MVDTFRVLDTLRFRDESDEDIDSTRSEFEGSLFFNGMADLIWFILNVLGFNWGIGGIGLALVHPISYIIKSDIDPVMPICMVIVCAHVLWTFVLCRFYRRVPYRSIGYFRKAIINMIILCAPLVLRHVLPYNVRFLVSLVGFTTYLLTLGQIMHFAADINRWDVFLGIMMQILVYTTGDSLYICSTVLVFCGAIIFYRYLSYEAPITPDDVKKDFGDYPNNDNVV